LDAIAEPTSDTCTHIYTPTGSPSNAVVSVSTERVMRCVASVRLVCVSVVTAKKWRTDFEELIARIVFVIERYSF